MVCGTRWLTATDVETGQTRLIRRSEQRILGLAWSPDGSRLAVRLAPLAGPASWSFVLFTIAPDGTNFVPQVVQRDGELLVVGGGRISLLEPESRSVEQGGQ